MIIWMTLFSLVLGITDLAGQNISQESALHLAPASKEEMVIIQEHMLDFYAKELVQAGLFSDEQIARKMANQEILDSDTERYFLHIINDQDLGNPVGYLVYYIESEKSAYLDAIYLYEKNRKKGLGKEAMLIFEKSLLQKEIESVRLYVFKHNQAAKLLYEHLGFSVEQSYENDGACIGYHMRKKLQPASDS